MSVTPLLTFKAGDLVPEWLVYIDPKSTESKPPRIEFVVSGVIVMFEGRHWLLSNETNAKSLIRASGGQDFSFGALTHDLVLPFQFQILQAVEGTTA